MATHDNEETMEALRERTLDEIIAIFSDSDPARVLRHIAHAAFMRGAWAGRIFDSGALLDLGEKDKVELMAKLAAGRDARREAL